VTRSNLRITSVTILLTRVWPAKRAGHTAPRPAGWTHCPQSRAVTSSILLADRVISLTIMMNQQRRESLMQKVREWAKNNGKPQTDDGELSPLVVHAKGAVILCYFQITSASPVPPAIPVFRMRAPFVKFMSARLSIANLILLRVSALIPFPIRVHPCPSVVNKSLFLVSLVMRLYR